MNGDPANAIATPAATVELRAALRVVRDVLHAASIGHVSSAHFVDQAGGRDAVEAGLARLLQSAARLDDCLHAPESQEAAITFAARSVARLSDDIGILIRVAALTPSAADQLRDLKSHIARGALVLDVAGA